MAIHAMRRAHVVGVDGVPLGAVLWRGESEFVDEFEEPVGAGGVGEALVGHDSADDGGDACGLPATKGPFRTVGVVAVAVAGVVAEVLDGAADDDGHIAVSAGVQRMLQLSPSTVYRMMCDGSIPSIRIGRSRRIPAGALLDIIDDTTLRLGSTHDSQVLTDGDVSRL